MTRQAYVHHPSRTAVFWAYKAANTSIVHAFAFDVLNLSRDIADPRLALNPFLVNYANARHLIESENYRSIALIREPYDRLVSAFLHIFVARENIGIVSLNQLEASGLTGYTEITGTVDGHFKGVVFRRFAEHCIEGIERRVGEPELDGHWNTQIPFEFLETNFSYDFLYPLDRSTAFFNKLGELTGKPIFERRLNEHRRTELLPRNLVDVSSLDYCNDATLRHPINFEDAGLRKRVEQAYAPDQLYFSLASNGTQHLRRKSSVRRYRVPGLGRLLQRIRRP